jgi:hypothetical protein
MADDGIRYHVDARLVGQFYINETVRWRKRTELLRDLGDRVLEYISTHGPRYVRLEERMKEDKPGEVFFSYTAILTKEEALHES